MNFIKEILDREVEPTEFSKPAAIFAFSKREPFCAFIVP